ncbi:MAG: ABC transporter ATP-binding protein [Candidatus Bipolaricaulis sp.]|nr:ABC transporter ATP-binding protein [Candidatus Bipolaricaulis sp.]
MADAAFEGRTLVKVFGELRAVGGITVAVQRGEIYGLVGPSGAGKTTLIRMLCGLTTPTSGEARLLGHLMPKERRAVEDRFGYMPQERAVYRDLSVGENLLFFGRIYGMSRPAVARRTRELLTLMRLADRAKQLSAHLSGGEKQRLSLACTLIHEPDALLLDEPTIGLDPALRLEFWDHFRTLAATGRTLLVSTHYVHEAERCGRVGLVQRGRLAAEGAPPDLKAWASTASGGPVSDMEDVFLILCRSEGGLR